MRPLTQLAPALDVALSSIGFSSAGIRDYLGPAAWDALFRGEPAAVDFALRDREEPLALAIRTFLLHLPASRADFEALLGGELCAQLISAGVLGHDATGLRTLIDVRPHVINDAERLVFSDMDASMLAGHIPGPDHVLGVGAASLSLLATTPRSACGSVLDLGTGSGIQALGQLGCADRIVATDVHPRALELAEATFAAVGAEVELREGPWFAPVAGERFDRIVSNPPFVVGPPEIGHVYRDSGLDLDGATELVVRELADHLNEGGTAHVLGAWVHREGESFQQRVASWLPDTGVIAWVLQRDVADPMLYVGTWLSDESIDPRSPEGFERTRHWLAHFDDAGVTGVGFGYIAVKKIADDQPSDILVEEFPQPYSSFLGGEIEEYFARAEWLSAASEADILDSRYALRPGLAKEDVTVADSESQIGFAPAVLRVTRTEGPQFSHEVDSHLASILAGLSPAGLSLGEVVELYAFSQGVDAEELSRGVVSPIVDLIRHGIIMPEALISQ